MTLAATNVINHNGCQIGRFKPMLCKDDVGSAATSAATDVINHNWRQIGRFKPMLCKDDVGSIAEPTPSLVWADVILANFQRVISCYLQDISTYLSCTAQRVLRTIFMQNSKPKYACLPNKIVEVWINWFCIRNDWWRRLQQCPRCVPGHNSIHHQLFKCCSCM